MTDQADERLKVLKASMKEALGKLTGSDELAAQGARERRGEVEPKAGTQSTPRAKKSAAPRGTKAGPPRRRS